jgi:general L-amino acid transport system substrate-binding protein
VLGDGAKFEFHPYALGQDFERLRRGDDAVAFLTGSELLANSLLDAVMPGPAVFHQTNGVMVLASSRAEHLADLAGTMVCAEPGTAPERTLLAYFRSHGLAISFSGWQEEEEMLDAFEVGRCPAVALETTALAAQRADGEARGHPIRILPEPLSASPILAVSGLDDARWAAVVAWTIHTLMQPSAASEALPIPGAGLGLTPGWRARAMASGAYAAIIARNLGAQSPLQLLPALDASWRDGGLLCPPDVE